MATFYYRIDRDARAAIYRIEGDVADRDLLEMSAVVSRDPDYEGGMSGIVDLREISGEVRVSSDGVRSLSAFNLSFPNDLNHARLAFVAAADLVYGYSRMLQAYSDELPGEYAVFRDIAAACEWLELPVEIFTASDGWVRVP